MKEMILNWVLERLSETSTWRGIVGLGMSAGLVIAPEMIAYIVATGSAAIGAINVVRKEQK